MAEPTVSLVTPDDSVFPTQRPELTFTGSDLDGDSLSYELEVRSEYGSPAAGSDVGHLNLLFAEGRFIATGTLLGETLFSSPDGKVFSQLVDLGGSDTVNLLAFQHGLYIVGRGTKGIITSSDGVSWTGYKAGSAGSAWTGASYVGGLHIVYSYSKTSYLTSPDGVTWTTRTIPATYGPRGMVAVGSKVIALCSDKLFESVDGISWSEITGVPADVPNMIISSSGLAVGEGVILYCRNASGSSIVYASYDEGYTWVNSGIPTCGKIAYHKGDFYCMSRVTVGGTYVLYRKRARSTTSGHDDTIALGSTFSNIRFAFGDKSLVYTTVTSGKPSYMPFHSFSSATDAGFENLTNPVDTDPFNSGDQVKYQLQPSLPSSEYLWSVRAVDASAENVVGPRAAYRSFTVTRPQNNTVFMQFLT